MENKLLIKIALYDVYKAIRSNKYHQTIDLSQNKNLIEKYKRKYFERFNEHIVYDENTLENLQSELDRVYDEKDDVSLNTSIIRSLIVEIYTNLATELLKELDVNIDRLLVDLCFDIIDLQEKGYRFYHAEYQSILERMKNLDGMNIDDSELYKFLTRENINKMKDILGEGDKNEK
nr:MAG TPA: hypothetical protein [Caudoviricetes sp.]